MRDNVTRTWLASEPQMRYEIKAVIRTFNHQDPYFSLTVDIHEYHNGRWQDIGGGADHETIVRVRPELEPLIKWHLCGITTGPMHYLANATYWHDMARGASKWSRDPHGPDPLEALRSTIVYGALPSDSQYDLMAMTPTELHDWLKRRLPMLLQAMRVELSRFNLWPQETR